MTQLFPIAATLRVYSRTRPRPPLTIDRTTNDDVSAACVDSRTLDPHALCARVPSRCSRRYFLIPLSALVSASMNAGRENSRSAYFISGAAGLGS